MKKKRYSKEQIYKILSEKEQGKSIQELTRKYGVTEQTFYRWKLKYDGMGLSELKRTKELESENAKLKRILADQMLQIDAMKDVLQKKW